MLLCIYKALPVVICYCGFHSPDKLHEILLWAMTIFPLMLPGGPKTWRASDVLLNLPTTRQYSSLLLTALALLISLSFSKQEGRCSFLVTLYLNAPARWPGCKSFAVENSLLELTDESACLPFPFILDTITGSEAEIPTPPLMGLDPTPVPDTTQHPGRPWCIEKDVLSLFSSEVVRLLLLGP